MERLKATTAAEARREIKSRFPGGASYTGFDEDGQAVIMSLVREKGNKAYVATVARNRSKKAVRFECVPL
jgi:hypothetical protein